MADNLADRSFLPREATTFRFGCLPSSHQIPPVPTEPIEPLGLPPLPSEVDRIKHQTSWGVMGNNVAGDCVLACMGHLTELWTGVVGKQFTPSDKAVLDAYSYVTGYDPKTHVPDPGMTIYNGLQWFESSKFSGHSAYFYRNSAYLGNLNSGRLSKLLSYAVYILGGAILGVRLPETATQFFSQGKTWTGGMGAPVHGHCVPVVSFDGRLFYGITWGGIQRIDIEFVKQYGFEVWFAASDDWLLPTGLSPIGHSRPQLTQFCRVLRVYGSVPGSPHPE